MNLTMSAPSHTPVLPEETIEALVVQPGGRYIDCTLGAGGHAAAILERSSPGGQLLGIDTDPEAIKIARRRLEAYSGSTLLVNQNFFNLKEICYKYSFSPVHGILFDLGLSSLQLNGSGRGFSFQQDAPLDMRLNPHQPLTAADIVNTSSEAELSRLIKTLGEESRGGRIAHYIVRERPIKTTLRLAEIVEQATGGRRSRIHPATKTFLALRIAVNQELENLKSALEQTIDLLGFEGRLVVISYHSLEDRIVKQFMQREARGQNARLMLVNKKVITPSLAEVQFNPRSRSAKLRAAERITIPKEAKQ
jgi:16S rRNA (cytosine1402-N4)-methyltransferase